MNRLKAVLSISLIILLIGNISYSKDDSPIVLRTMGSLFFGGDVTTLENGETFHGNHGYF